MTNEKLVVLSCGGGNGSHVTSVLAAARPNTESRVLTLFADEAERWTKAMGNDDMNVNIAYSDGTSRDVKAKPSFITKDPAKAVPGADLIFIVLPAFAHSDYFKAIAPHVSPNTVIVGLPGQAGFNMNCIYDMGNKSKNCAIANFETLPFNCRIVEFGRKAQIIGFKGYCAGSVIMGQSKPKMPPMDMIQSILGPDCRYDDVGNFVAIYLLAKSICHPPLMYGTWSKWDGNPLDEAPLFYQGVDQWQADLLEGIGDECVAIAKDIEKKRPGTKMDSVIPMLDWMKRSYCELIADSSSLYQANRTNKGYDGLYHPMIKTPEGKLIPDFSTRYLSEDIPFGLCVMKGIGELAGTKTPVIDEVITWCQGKLNKEYLVGSELKGKDLKDTRAPQKYGYMTLEQLFSIM